MQIYALIGKTGTGKSYKAEYVANKYNSKDIIDDAILIKSNRVIAGRSAKTKATKIASVKAAIFLNEEDRVNIKEAIDKYKPSKLLILGTSDEMIDRIVENLDLGEIFKKIYIEDISTKEEIALAQKTRNEEGKHVVPVPTFAIKEQFSGYFMDPLKIFSKLSKSDKEKVIEKTIIRPTYSYLGSYTISEKVINNIVTYEVSKINGIAKILNISSNKYLDGVSIVIDLRIEYGINIQNLSKKIHKKVIEKLDYTTRINIFSISINIKDIQIKKN